MKIALFAFGMWLANGTVSAPARAEELKVKFNGYSEGTEKIANQISGTLELDTKLAFVSGQVSLYLNGVRACLLPAKQARNLGDQIIAHFASRKIKDLDECAVAVREGGRVKEVVVRATIKAVSLNGKKSVFENRTVFNVNIAGDQSSNLSPCGPAKPRVPWISGRAKADVLNTKNPLIFDKMANGTRAALVLVAAKNLTKQAYFSHPKLAYSVNDVFLKEGSVNAYSYYERGSGQGLVTAKNNPLIALTVGPTGRSGIYSLRLQKEWLDDQLQQVTIEPALEANARLDVHENRVCYGEVETEVTEFNLEE